MNSHTHHLIFNRSRGCMMPVAETAKSSGRASGESRPSRKSKSNTATCRKARPALHSNQAWLQANHCDGYGLPCLQGSFSSALSRKSSERFAASQLGSDPFAPWLASGHTPLTFGVRPQMFAATQSTVTAGSQLMDTGQAASAKNASVSATVSFGTSTSSSTTNTASNSAAGSSIDAAGNVNIQATGNASQGAGNILVQGSNVNANNNVTLAATGNVDLLAAANTQSQTSTSSSSSTSVGVAMTLGKSNSLGVTGSVSGSRGNADGQDLTYTNTNVNAGKTLNIQSGGNTNLIGAVASGNTTNVNVGGNLVIQSLQDKSTYDSKDTSFGVTGTYGYGASASATVGKTTINSNFQSVNQTSGIRAGDGGFNVNVGGNTTLIGGQITSSANASAAGANTFSTNGTLTTTDIQNKSEFDAKSMSVTVGVGGQAGASGGGIGQMSGSQSSTTVSAISAGNISVGGVQTNTSSNGNSLNTNTTTGQNDSGIKNTFNAQDVKADVAAQVQITKAFGQQAAQTIAVVSDGKVADLTKQAKDARDAGNETLAKELEADADKWKEGGTYRVALHAVAGGLTTGNIQGALGSGTSAAMAPVLDEMQAKMQQTLEAAGMSKDNAKMFAQGIAGLTSLGMGAAVGGTAGAATGFNTDSNNRQLVHTTEGAVKKWATDNAQKTGMTEEQLYKASMVALGDYLDDKGNPKPEFANVTYDQYMTARNLMLKTPTSDPIGAEMALSYKITAPQFAIGDNDSGKQPNLARLGVSNPLVRFGTNPNDPNHPWRHAEKDFGIKPEALEQVVRTDLVSKVLNPGFQTGTVTVNGVTLQYNVFVLPNGQINVGSIRPPGAR